MQNLLEVERDDPVKLGGQCCGICCCPCILIGVVILLGWNEKRAVCEAKAIVEGKEKVLENQCTDAMQGDGKLVMFACDLQQNSLPTWTSSGAFTTFSHVGVCLSTKSYMLQCVEESRTVQNRRLEEGGFLQSTGEDSWQQNSPQMQKSELVPAAEPEPLPAPAPNKVDDDIEEEERSLQQWSNDNNNNNDNSGSTSTSTRRVYIYSLKWKSRYVSSRFYKAKQSYSFIQNCGIENPRWPVEVPMTEVRVAESGKIGPYTVKKELLEKIDCTTPVDTIAPPGFSKVGYRLYRGSNYIGSVRVSFFSNSNSSSKAKHTILGKNSGGVIDPWRASSSWLCSGYTLSDLREGAKDKDELFETLQAESTGMTWVLRIVGFLILWCSFALLGLPFQAAAECVPCIGEMLGQLVYAAVCVVSCFPASLVCVFVILVCWCAMRPAIVLPLMLVVVCAAAGGIGWSVKQQRDKKQRMLPTYGNSPQQAAMPVYGAAPPAQVMQPQSVQPPPEPVGAPIQTKAYQGNTGDQEFYPPISGEKE
mmetsp:Transcript_93366/g.171144  ORF Transcript_93366/g.171144 Transcript_93366/m.171144 type:complete len:533 (+) Transcript_93366:135-1733(+)